MQEVVRKAVKPKFRGRSTLKSKVITRFPENIAEDYERIVRAYNGLLLGALKAHLPTIRKAIEAEDAGMRTDAADDVTDTIQRTMDRVLADFERKARSFGLDRRIEDLAKMTHKRSIREWKRVVHQTLGINILDDYYNGERYISLLNRWIADNTALIKSLPQSTVTRMTSAIKNGYMSGATTRSIAGQIMDLNPRDYGFAAEMTREAYEEAMEEYNKDLNHAVFVARDQLAKLNADITQTQQRDAGVEKYVWDDSGDSRVRACHEELSGQTFRWDDPPEMWYKTKGGRVYTGRRCHPGEDYECRCVALPVFDEEGIDLPWQGKEQ